MLVRKVGVLKFKKIDLFVSSWSSLLVLTIIKLILSWSQMFLFSYLWKRYNLLFKRRKGCCKKIWDYRALNLTHVFDLICKWCIPIQRKPEMKKYSIEKHNQIWLVCLAMKSSTWVLVCPDFENIAFLLIKWCSNFPPPGFLRYNWQIKSYILKACNVMIW